jgi:hypothetical protein
MFYKIFADFVKNLYFYKSLEYLIIMTNNMKKLKVKWNPEINQDIDAVTNPKSQFYDEDLTNKIIEKYGTIDKFRKVMESEVVK